MLRMTNQIISAFTIFTIIIALCHANDSRISDNGQVVNRHRRESPQDLKFITNFAWKLFSKSNTSDPDSNLVLSPISVQLCLALLQQTAAGETLRQFNEVLDSDNFDPQLIGNAVSQMRPKYSDSEFLSATAIVPTIDYKINETFLENSRKSHVSVIPIDFRDVKSAANIINTWVSNATKEQIKQIVEEDVTLASTKLMLMNAIYFSGAWLYPFNSHLTRGDFHQSSSNVLPVKFMRLRQDLPYGEKILGEDNFGYRWVELPYLAYEYSMIIVLPTQRCGLAKLIESMTNNDLSDIINGKVGNNNITHEKISLTLPKFSIKSDISLIETLQQFGLTDPFSGSSNMPYLANDQQISINRGYQMAVLSVDEKGTVAAAITVFQLAGSSGRPVPEKRIIDFLVDEPFLSIIIDRKQRLPIFISKIYNPKNSN